MAGPGIDLGSVWASVGVRLDGLFRGVSQAQQAMRTLDRQLTSQAQQTSTRVSSIFDNLGRTIERTFAAIFSVYAVRRFAEALDDLAATAFSAQAGLNIFARQVARTGQELDAALRLIGGLAQELRVPQEILARSAAELLRYGYSVQQIVDIFRGAVASGLLVGRTTVDAINTVTEALVSQRSVLLNVIGITENLDPALVRYARSLGKTAEELTNAERATAAWRMITQATAAEVADLELLLEGYGGAVADVGTQSYNLRRVLGEALLPAVTAVRQAWAEMLDTMARLAQTAGVRSAIQSIGQAFTSIIGALRDALQWLAVHRDLIRELAERVIPAFIAVISARLIPQLVALVTQLLTLVSHWGLVAGAIVLAVEALHILNRAAGQDLFNRLLASMAANARQLIANLQYMWEWLTSGGRVSEATRRMWEEVTRQGNEAARAFQDALVQSVETLTGPDAWSRIRAAFDQRMAEIRAMLTGAALPGLQPVQPTVTGAAGLPGIDEGTQAADKFAEAARKFQVAIALARVGQGDLNQALGEYAQWLARVVQGQEASLQSDQDRAKAAQELLNVFAELMERGQELAIMFGDRLPQAMMAALVLAARDIPGELARMADETAELTGRAFERERQQLEHNVGAFRVLLHQIYPEGSEALQSALATLDAYYAAKLQELEERQRQFYLRQADEAARAEMQLIDRLAELGQIGLEEQARRLEALLATHAVSAEMREEILHRVAMLRRQAAKAIVEQTRTLADALRALRDARGEAIVEATEETRAAYAEIERLRMTDRQRFEADLAARVAELRAAGVDAITIEQWVAAQRALQRERELQEIVRREREAAQEARRAWADALLGPFADPLARLVEGFRAFRVGERLAEAFAPLRALFAETLPSLLQRGLSRVMAWVRDQAGRIGDAMGRVLGAAGGALGGVGQAAAGAVGSVLGALGSAAGAAAGAIGALVGAVGEFLVALLEASPQFRQFSRILEQIFSDVARTVGALIEPFIPVVQSLREALAPILEAVRPLLRQVGEVFAAFARLALQLLAPILQLLQPILRGMLWLLDNIVVPVLNVLGATLVAVYNAIAKAVNLIINAINFLYPFGDLIKWRMKEATWTPIQRSDEVDTGASGGGEGAAGYQIARITGPTRDFFAELLRPIGALNILPGLFDNLTRAVYAVRDLLAASLGASLAGAADALAAAATSLSDAVTRLVAAVEALTASLRSENGAMVVEMVQSMEIARVVSVTIARVDVIQVAQAGTVQVVGGRMRSPWDWALGLRGVGA